MSVSKKFCKAEYDNLVAWLSGHCDPVALAHLLKWDEVKLWPGRIVGTMDYYAMCHISNNTTLARECRVWNEGYPNWWILSNIRRLSAPIPCCGNVGMWRLSPQLSEAIYSLLAQEECAI